GVITKIGDRAAAAVLTKPHTLIVFESERPAGQLRRTAVIDAISDPAEPVSGAFHGLLHPTRCSFQCPHKTLVLRVPTSCWQFRSRSLIVMMCRRSSRRQAASRRASSQLAMLRIIKILTFSGYAS